MGYFRDNIEKIKGYEPDFYFSVGLSGNCFSKKASNFGISSSAAFQIAQSGLPPETYPTGRMRHAA